MNRRKFIKTILFGIMGMTMFPFIKNFYKRDVPPYIITPDGPGNKEWILQGNPKPTMFGYDIVFVENRKIQIKEIIKVFKIPKSILSRR